MGSQILKLPESRGLIFQFQFGKMLRVSSEAPVVLADRDCPAICAFRAVTANISAAQRTGWDLTAGHLFPVVTTEGGRGSLPLSAARMTTTLQSHSRAGELPSHSTMHYFRVGGSLSKPLAGRRWMRSRKLVAGRRSRWPSTTSGLPLALYGEIRWYETSTYVF